MYIAEKTVTNYDYENTLAYRNKSKAKLNPFLSPAAHLSRCVSHLTLCFLFIDFLSLKQLYYYRKNYIYYLPALHLKMTLMENVCIF